MVDIVDITVIAMQRISKELPDTLFIYHDTPIGTEERSNLQEAAPGLEIVTTIQILLFAIKANS